VRALRNLFILEAVFSVVTGLGLLFAPGGTLDLYGLDTDAVGRFMTQTCAGLYIGIGLLAWLVRNVREPVLVASLTTVYGLYHFILLFVALRAWLGDDFDFDLGWVSALIEISFGVAFAYFRLRPPKSAAG
jgi:hypothetical protein